MDDLTSTGELTPEQRIALAYAARANRARFAGIFLLDRLLSQAVSRTREPIAGQIRLAWWRDTFTDRASAPADPRATALIAQWGADRAPAIAMIDGWELLLAAEPDVAGCAIGRAAPFGALARDLGCGAEVQEAAHGAAERWALVDLASNLSSGPDREVAFELARNLKTQGVALPRALRPLAILDGLARRALARNEPMLGSRASPLVAIRLGIFGR